MKRNWELTSHILGGAYNFLVEPFVPDGGVWLRHNFPALHKTRPLGTVSSQVFKKERKST